MTLFSLNYLPGGSITKQRHVVGWGFHIRILRGKSDYQRVMWTLFVRRPREFLFILLSSFFCSFKYVMYIHIY